MHPVVVIDGVKETAVQERDFAIEAAVITVVMAPVNTKRLVKSGSKISLKKFYMRCACCQIILLKNV